MRFLQNYDNSNETTSFWHKKTVGRGNMATSSLPNGLFYPVIWAVSRCGTAHIAVRNGAFCSAERTVLSRCLSAEGKREAFSVITTAPNVKYISSH